MLAAPSKKRATGQRKPGMTAPAVNRLGSGVAAVETAGSPYLDRLRVGVNEPHELHAGGKVVGDLPLHLTGAVVGGADFDGEVRRQGRPATDQGWRQPLVAHESYVGDTHGVGIARQHKGGISADRAPYGAGHGVGCQHDNDVGFHRSMLPAGHRHLP